MIGRVFAEGIPLDFVWSLNVSLKLVTSHVNDQEHEKWPGLWEGNKRECCSPRFVPFVTSRGRWTPHLKILLFFWDQYVEEQSFQPKVRKHDVYLFDAWAHKCFASSAHLNYRKLVSGINILRLNAFDFILFGASLSIEQFFAPKCTDRKDLCYCSGTFNSFLGGGLVLLLGNFDERKNSWDFERSVTLCHYQKIIRIFHRVASVVLLLS